MAVLQWGFWLTALLGLKVQIPLLHKMAAPAGALLVLNVAAVAGLYKFLFTAGPLWKIWSIPSSAAESSTHLATKRRRA